MTELEEARRFALSLPEAIAEPHVDKASFRVRGSGDVPGETIGQHS